MNRIGYYIREGVDSIFNHGLISFTTICVILACLLIMGSFASVAVNVNHIIGNLEDQVSILAFVTRDAPPRSFSKPLTLKLISRPPFPSLPQ